MFYLILIKKKSVVLRMSNKKEKALTRIRPGEQERARGIAIMAGTQGRAGEGGRDYSRVDRRPQGRAAREGNKRKDEGRTKRAFASLFLVGLYFSVGLCLYQV